MITLSDPRRKYTTSTVGELCANCEAKVMNEEGPKKSHEGRAAKYG